MTEQATDSSTLQSQGSPIKRQLQGLLGKAGKLALRTVARKVENTTTQSTGSADGGGLRRNGQRPRSEGRMGKFMGLPKLAFGGLRKELGFGGRAGEVRKFKLYKIVASLDVDAPRRVVYNQWTQFEDFPSFMKKVEKVVQESDEKLNWQLQIFEPRRSWASTIMEQVPDETIIWRSKAAKGCVDGSITFHVVTPNMTRVLMVLEYHARDPIEHIGALCRTQGRRARLEFKHVRRHVMTKLLAHPGDVDVIHDDEVIKDHETALGG